MAELVETSTLPAPALRRFLLRAAACYAVWYGVYELWLGPAGRLDTALSVNIAAAAAAVLRVAGFPAHVASADAQLLMMGPQMAVYVGNPCNGLVLYALFAGFVLAYPGAARRRLWFVPAGILAIYALNVVRVAALALNHFYWQQTVDFNHHYTFTFVVYGCICLLWMAWVRQSGGSPQPAAFRA